METNKDKFYISHNSECITFSNRKHWKRLNGDGCSVVGMQIDTVLFDGWSNYFLLRSISIDNRTDHYMLLRFDVKEDTGGVILATITLSAVEAEHLKKHPECLSDPDDGND